MTDIEEVTSKAVAAVTELLKTTPDERKLALIQLGTAVGYMSGKIESLQSELATLRARLQTEQARVGACQSAAIGYLDNCHEEFNTPAFKSVVKLRKELEEVRKQYNELLFAVSMKHPNETRHETALRYIRQAEMPQDNPPQCARQRSG